MEQSDLFIVGFFSSLLSLILFYIVALIFLSIWQVFRKAGQPGWASIVPIYNLFILLKIAGKPTSWIILFLIPIVNIIPAILVNISIAEKFGRSQLFGGFGLTFLSFIFYPILAFSDSKYTDLEEIEISPSNLDKLGVLLGTFLVCLFISYPFQTLMGLITHLTMNESSTPLYDIPKWSIWITSSSNILFFIILITIWNLRKIGAYGFIGLSILLFIFNVIIGYPILLSLLIFIEPLILILFVWKVWSSFE